MSASPVTVTFSALKSPLVLLVRRDGLTSRGIWAVRSLAEVWEAETVRCLTPCDGTEEGELARFIAENGATVANVAFARTFEMLPRFLFPKKQGFRVTLVGLGDVGGTVLTGLKLLGHEIDEVAIYDPNTALCSRNHTGILSYGNKCARKSTNRGRRHNATLFNSIVKKSESGSCAVASANLQAHFL